MTKLIVFMIYLIIFQQFTISKPAQKKNKRGLGTVIAIGGIVLVVTIVLGSAAGSAAYLVYYEKLKNGESEYRIFSINSPGDYFFNPSLAWGII